jgi:hypothetical protein
MDDAFAAGFAAGFAVVGGLANFLFTGCPADEPPWVDEGLREACTGLFVLPAEDFLLMVL